MVLGEMTTRHQGLCSTFVTPVGKTWPYNLGTRRGADTKCLENDASQPTTSQKTKLLPHHLAGSKLANSSG